ncbi:MAG: NAD-dependent epimerase/dehydratase family protein [Reichenbachiella sp.]|uniref:NAD-dependent epimerase/dehydratase family protein n=1 Tax=Reichenbachiella sp. TaxID=2184521 RepID=UPI003297E334
MPTSLVTGGAGFIGSHVAEELLAKGHRVIIVDDLSGGSLKNAPKDAAFVEGSILDEAFLSSIFDEYAIDYIYHLAAYAAEGLSHFIKKFNYQNNLIGSVNLINEAVKHEIKCFVFTSSIAVYGSQPTPMTEKMIPQPEDPYGIAKYAVEQELVVSKEMFGLDYVIFRPHNVYGERQNISDPYRNVIGIFMNQLMNGESLSIFGDGHQTRAFTYIKDIAPILARCVDKKEMYGQVFNIGADQEISVRNLAKMVMHAMKTESTIDFLEARTEVLHAFSSHQKLIDYYGKIPSTHLNIGLEKMAKWAQSVSHEPTKKFDQIEITKNLPSFWK